jgi:hypothetical protein
MAKNAKSKPQTIIYTPMLPTAESVMGKMCDLYNDLESGRRRASEIGPRVQIATVIIKAGLWDLKGKQFALEFRSKPSLGISMQGEEEEETSTMRQ